MTLLTPLTSASPIYAEMDQLKVLMRDCQHRFRTQPFGDTQKAAEVCAAAMKKIDGMVAGADSKVQVEYMFLCRDYSCLASRVALAARKQPKPREYLPFEQATCVFRPASQEHNKSIEELDKALSGCGFVKDIDYSVNTEDPSIQFSSSNWGVLSFPTLNPDLKPFFYHEFGPCIDRFYQAYDMDYLFDSLNYVRPSNKGLIEDFNYRRSVMKPRFDRLLAEAERYFSQWETPPEPVKYTALPPASDEELIQDILVKHDFPGICIGENHDEESPLRFIYDNLESLQRSGVRTLFMEMFAYNNSQPYLDEYFATGKMHHRLEATRKGFDRTRYGMVSALVRKAKSLGIRIVGIDTSVAKSIGDNQLHVPKRWKTMNYVADKIIRHEKSGKFVILTGLNHGSTMRPPEGGFVPGLAELCRCPNIIIEDSGNKAGVRINDSPYREGKYCHFHTHVYMLKHKVPS